MVLFSKQLPLGMLRILSVLQPPETNAPGFGLFRVRSPLLAESLLFSSPPGTEMFQFPGLPLRLLGVMSLHDTGFPHSDIHGSKVVCTSPRLIAAYHVLRRLWEPRHPPCALACFLLFAV